LIFTSVQSDLLTAST